MEEVKEPIKETPPPRISLFMQFDTSMIRHPLYRPKCYLSKSYGLGNIRRIS